MKVYVVTGKDGYISAYHTSNEFTAFEEVEQESPTIDIFKLQGYKIQEGKLIFDEDQYAAYVAEKEKEAAIENGTEMMEQLVNQKVLAAATEAEAYVMRYLYPEWDGNGVKYEKDDRFMYNNKFYKVLQKHTSQLDWTPNTASSLYVEISDPNVKYPEYKQPINAETAYKNGDKVTYKNKKYLCVAPDGAACVWSPEEYPLYWQLIEEETK